MHTEIGTRIKKLRIANELSQQAFADALQVSRQTVSKWENGRTYPDIGHMLLMCELFETNLDELLREDNTSENVTLKSDSTQPKLGKSKKWLVGLAIVAVLTVLAYVSLNKEPADHQAGSNQTISLGTPTEVHSPAFNHAIVRNTDNEIVAIYHFPQPEYQDVEHGLEQMSEEVLRRMREDFP